MPNQYLYHYGVKGMHWGVRRYQRSDGTLTPAGKRRRIRELTSDTYKRHADETDRYRSAKKQTRANIRSEKANLKTLRRQTTKNRLRINDEYEEAKKSVKKNLPDPVKLNSAIKKYRQSWDDAEIAQEIADAKWADATSKYKALGKTTLTKMMNAMSGKNDLARIYSSSYDDWEKAQSEADRKYAQAKKDYLATGHNFINRVMNNIEYDRKRK
jgi:hypothetical protein